VRTVLLLILLTLGVLFDGLLRVPEKTPVFVLGTLYKRHEAVPRYDLAALRRALSAIQPAALVLDVTPEELAARKVWPGKIEYPGVIFPFIDAGRYRVYAAEPDEPMFSEIVQSISAAVKALEREQPEVSAGLDRLEDAAYGALYRSWQSPADVNSAVTDRVMSGKQALESRLVGPVMLEGGERWNRHVLDVILQATRENRGRRVLVLVGIENRHWFVEHLRGLPDVELVEMESWLRQNL
jgi:hypothetical protein